MSVGFLLDKSALARWRHPSVAAVLNPALSAGRLWTCPPIELEVLYSSRSPADFEELRRARDSVYQQAPLDTAVGRLARSLQARLAAVGRLRSVGPMDLIIAATAMVNDLVVLHYDRDFEILAEVVAETAHRWVVPRGSVG